MPAVLTVVERLYNALPINSSRTLQYIAADEVLERCAAIVLDVSLYELQEVVIELVQVLSQTFDASSRREGLADSQMYLLRLISQCIEHANESFLTGRTAHQVLDSSTVTCVLACYFRLAVFSVSKSETPLTDLPSPTKSIRFPRPTSQFMHRPTSQLFITRQITPEVTKPSVLPLTRQLSDLSVTSSKADEELQQHFSVLIRFVSSTNWPATLEVTHSILRQPYVDDEEEAYNKKLHLFSYLTLDQSSIDVLLGTAKVAFCSLLKTSQLELIESLHHALSSWIRTKPQELSVFRHAVKVHGFNGGLQLYDALMSFADSSTRKKNSILPLLAILRTIYTSTPTQLMVMKKSKKDTLIKDLKHALASNKGPAATLGAYAQVLSIISHLPSEDVQISMMVIKDMLGDMSMNNDIMNDCVERGAFSACTDLFGALYRLNLPETIKFAQEKLDIWLDARERSFLKIQAIQCVAAIFADSSQPALSSGRQELFRIASGRIKIPLVAPSVSESSEIPATDLSSYILDMFCTAPQLILAGQDHKVAMHTAIDACLGQQQLTLNSTAGRLLVELQTAACIRGELFGRKLHDQGIEFFAVWAHSSAQSIQGIIKRLLVTEPPNVEEIILLLDLLSKCLAERIATLSFCKDQLGSADDIQSHDETQELLEIALLRFSCHVNFSVATKAAEACIFLVDETRIYREHAVCRAAKLDNNELYFSMARETFLTPGRNAVQKKIRNRLRSAQDTPALRKAWLVVFELWSKLTDSLFGVRNINAIQGHETSLEWQNYTGFLAALARVEGSNHEDPVYAFIARFKEVFIQSQTEFISEVCAEIIGNALHLSLYAPMLQEVQQMISTMKDRKGVLIVRSRHTITMEQLILICRGLFERLESFLPFQEGLNVGEIMIDLARYLQLCGQTYIRSRLRFCQLCEIFANRYNLMCILRENSVRRRLCNFLGGWIALSGSSSTDLEKITRETNAACLKALAGLSRNLPFGIENESTGRQLAGDIKSLIQVVLPLSSMSEEECTQFSSVPLGPILIELLSHALVANQRAATSAFISLCYHENNNVGAIFTSTVAKSLKLHSTEIFQGLNLDDVERKLWNLVTTDASTLTALLDGSPNQGGPLEALTQAYESQGCMLQMFGLVLDTEIAICDQEAELFRRNSATTRLFALYVSRRGGSYVQNTLKKSLDTLISRPEEYRMELDKEKLSAYCADAADMELHIRQNKDNVVATCQQFIDAICDSVSTLPEGLRSVMRLVGKKTARKYPNAVERSIGSFLILRMFGPVIVKSSKGSPRLQRQLILIVKILTNLANNTYFKEGHLVVLNHFLRDNMQKLSHLFQTLATGQESDVPEIAFNFEQAQLPQLHQHFQVNADRIRNKLIEIELKQGSSVESLRASTNHMRRLLCQLGEPDMVLSPALGPDDHVAKSGGFYSAPLPECSQVFRQIGLTQKRKPLYYLELSRFTNLQSSAVINLCAGIRQIMSDMTGGSTEILLDVTGFSTKRLPDSTEFRKSFKNALLMHDRTMYIYNANKAFVSYMCKHFDDIWSERASHIEFLDHQDTLEFYFDPAVCLHLASTHGLFVKAYPHELTYIGAESQVETSVRMVLRSDDTLSLSTIDRVDVAHCSKSRLTEEIVVKHVQDIQFNGDRLEITMRDQEKFAIRTNDPRREMQTLESFMTQALEQFKTANPERLETIWALLLCVGLVKVSSTDPLSRDSGAAIMLHLLPDAELRKVGILGLNAASLTSLNSDELNELHLLAHKDASILSRMTFLDELLTRLPYLPSTERRTTLPCLNIWLADISIMAKSSPEHADVIRRILLSLLNLHSPLEDSRLSLVLWTSLGRQESLKELLYQHLSSYACLYQYNSRQVLKVSQIFRTLNICDAHFVTRLAKDLVTQVDAKLHKSTTDLAEFDGWTSVQVLLRLLVDLTARNANVVKSLPDIMYIVMSLHNLGNAGISPTTISSAMLTILDLRTLEYHLFINTVAAAACSTEIDETKRKTLLEIVDDMQTPLQKHTFSLPMSELSDWFNKNGVGFNGGPQHKDLVMAEHYAVIARLMVGTLRNAARDQDQEHEFIHYFSQLIMHTIVQASPIRRRPYILLGIISAELSLATVQPLVNALQLELATSTTFSASREALSVILSLSMTTLPNSLALLKLALALSTYPGASIASAGLHLLLRCLDKVYQEKTVSDLENCLKQSTRNWLEIMKLIGVSATSNLTLCLSSIFLQAFKVTREKALVKKIVTQIICIYCKQSDSRLNRAALSPAVLLHCALSDSLQEMIVIVSSVGVDMSDECRSCEQAIQRLFAFLQVEDDADAVATLAVLMSLLASAETTEEQIKALKTMAIAAQFLPRAFQTIFDDMDLFLKSILQRSNHLPLLKAVQEIIIANKKAELAHGPIRLSDDNADKDTILRNMGFLCFTREWEHTNHSLHETAHKKCISNMIISKET